MKLIDRIEVLEEQIGALMDENKRLKERVDELTTDIKDRKQFDALVLAYLELEEIKRKVIKNIRSQW